MKYVRSQCLAVYGARSWVFRVCSCNIANTTLQRPFELDSQALLQFTTSAFILSPLTFLWLEGLEARFPGQKVVQAPKPKTEGAAGAQTKLNVTNTVLKIVIDQVVGGAWNTVAFIITMGLLRGQDWETITLQIQNVWFSPGPLKTANEPPTGDGLANPSLTRISGLSWSQVSNSGPLCQS